MTNLKPDNEDAENEEKLLANYNTKKKYRQVRTLLKFRHLLLTYSSYSLNNCCTTRIEAICELTQYFESDVQEVFLKKKISCHLYFTFDRNQRGMRFIIY